MPVCNKCDKEVRGRQKQISCTTCKLEYHTKCQGVSDEKYEFLIENSDVLWFCKSCKVVTANMVTKLSNFELRISAIETSLLSQQEANRILEEKILTLKGAEKTIQELTESMNQIKEKDMADLKEEVQFLRSKLYNHAEVKKMESIHTKQKIDDLEQESKLNNLRIVGIPEDINVNDENLLQKFLTIANEKLNLQAITKDDIDQCYRLGKPNDLKARDVIVRFNNREKRNLVFKCKRNMPREDPPIYINEDLTQPRNKLFYDARCLRKTKKIHATWTQEGNIIIKVTVTSDPVPVRTHRELRSVVFNDGADMSDYTDSFNSDSQEFDVDSD